MLSCPLHDALAFFLVSKDLARLSHGCRTLRVELTVEGLEASTGQRLLLVPVVELRIETAEAELARVSLPHIHTLRVMHRLSFNALADFVKRNGSQALWSLDKFACRGVRLHPHDVTEMLVPILSTTRELKLLNLQNNVIVDATVQRLCESGILDRVETLNLRFNKVGNEGAKAIAAAGKNLRWINLKMNMVGDEGALALAAMVRESNTIQLLNLRRQAPGLTDRAAFGFAEMLKANVSLEKLRLRRNRITDKGVAALAAVAGERLQRLCAHRPIWEAVYLELDFEENRVTDEGALSLLRMASSAPARARLEVLLHGNKATRDSLRLLRPARRLRVEARIRCLSEVLAVVVKNASASAPESREAT